MSLAQTAHERVDGVLVSRFTILICSAIVGLQLVPGFDGPASLMFGCVGALAWVGLTLVAHAAASASRERIQLLRSLDIGRCLGIH